MKYCDLIQFGPITSAVKLTASSEMDVAQSLVKQYVFSRKIKEDIWKIIVRNLSVTPSGNTFGIQVVGGSGTGKSHLMAIIAAIAENDSILAHLQDDWICKDFKQFSGRYKVLRIDIGTNEPLKDVLSTHLEQFLKTQKIRFKFDETSSFSWKMQLQKMMAGFEKTFPNKHLLVVIDDLEEYLKERSPVDLDNDLMTLCQLGEMCDNSRFKVIFAAQKILYQAPELQLEAEMMSKLKDCYSDFVITKEDISFVVKERLLKKNEHQKAQIHHHLSGFSHLFEDMQHQFNEYVEMFPVHPRYIDHIERIKHGKNQRDILKVLSIGFGEILDSEVPSRSPGLITYDRYWKVLSSTMNTIPDICKVMDISEIIHEKIQKFFTGALFNKRRAAGIIADALCLSILYDDTDKKSGADAKSLCNDLCITFPGVNDAERLLTNVETTAKLLVSATSGQYIDVDEQTNDFYIRVEEDRNFDQDITDYVELTLSRNPERSDTFFYDFLQHIILPRQKANRRNNKIFEHGLNWLDKNSYRLGYIFFGAPTARSITEPIQEYFIFFCPLFSKTIINEFPDEVYFDFSGLSDDFKKAVHLWSAAKILEGSAPIHQKIAFRKKLDMLHTRATEQFENEYIEKAHVIYNGRTHPLKSFPLLAEGSTKEQIFSGIAARLLNPHFNEKYPNYPALKDLNRPIRIELDKIEQLHERSRKFSKWVSYLAQAVSFLPTSEQPLYDHIQNAVTQLPEKLIFSDTTEIARYETTLKALIDRYAAYYMSCYTQYRLSRETALQKEKIMTSDNKRICDILCDADFLSLAEYINWLKCITSLKEADQTVTKDIVKEEPYHDFNPKEYAGKPVYHIADLAEQLQSILDKWIKIMRSIFKDPSVINTLDIQDPDDQALAENFRSGACDLTVANAHKLSNLISTRSKGIEVVELTSDNIKSIFSKPLMPNDAISAFTYWIDSICEGKERSKIRIIYI